MNYGKVGYLLFTLQIMLSLVFNLNFWGPIFLQILFSKLKHTNAVMRVGPATLLLKCESFLDLDACTHQTFNFF